MTGTPAPLLESALPDFAVEFRRALEVEGYPDLAAQVRELRIVDRCRCGDDYCATFHTVPRPQGSWGPHHKTIPLASAATGMINVDVVAGRIVAVEVLHRDDLCAALAGLFG